MRVVLHIGCEKTGTSTIQSFLHENQGALRQLGFLFPLSPCGPRFPSHLKLSAYARRKDRADEVRALLGIVNLSEFRAATASELIQECRGADCHTLILSSEHLSSRLNFDDEIRILKQLIDQIGPAKVVLYLRRQDDALVSGYSTKVRLGSSRPFELPDCALFSELYDYKRMCTIWADCFGKNALDVRIFSRAPFVAGGLLADFCAACGLPWQFDNVAIPAPENVSISALYLEFLRHFNVYLPHMSPETGGHPNAAQGDLLEVIEILDRRESDMRRRFQAPRHLLDRLMEMCADGNAYVARTFLSREDGILFEESPFTQSECMPELTMDSAFKIFANIWRESVLRNQSKMRH
jgi:hypothetical protein